MIKTASADMHTKQHTTSLINVLGTLKYVFNTHPPTPCFYDGTWNCYYLTAGQAVVGVI
jgi:hypothetical protein